MTPEGVRVEVPEGIPADSDRLYVVSEMTNDFYDFGGAVAAFAREDDARAFAADRVGRHIEFVGTVIDAWVTIRERHS